MNFNAVHNRENNPNSQARLELKREDFNEQCWKVLVRMLKGERLTVADTAPLGENHISSLPRRAKDLIDGKGIPVKRQWAVVNGVVQDYKEYFIEEEDRLKTANRIIDLMTTA